jgi:lantibiotic modifying enzyme
MLGRLERDRKRLTAIVPDISRQRIKRITPGLSDPHDRGQTVTIVQFNDGSRIVYKPRDCEGERIWFSALQWLNENGFEPRFHVPKLISRGKYSWMSFVAHRPCRSKRGLRDFYSRWGAQAAVAQLLGCADLHRQNWIAAGEHPVLVDGEMVGDAFSQQDRGANPMSRLHPLLRTGLLPIFQADGVGRYEGIGPFDGSNRKKETNVFWPTYHGRAQRPDKYINEIASGFEAAARFICDLPNRKRFERFILQAARRKNLRVLKRATIQYRRILDESLQPNYLQKRGERLRHLVKRCGPDRVGAIEAQCLARCSVPRFTQKLSPNRKKPKPVPALRVMFACTKLLRTRLLANR